MYKIACRYKFVNKNAWVYSMIFGFYPVWMKELKLVSNVGIMTRIIDDEKVEVVVFSDLREDYIKTTLDEFVGYILGNTNKVYANNAVKKKKSMKFLAIVSYFIKCIGYLNDKYAKYTDAAR